MEEALHLGEPPGQEPPVGADGVAAQGDSPRFAQVLPEEGQGGIAGLGQGGGGGGNRFQETTAGVHRPYVFTHAVQNFGGLGGYAARQIHEFLGPKKSVVLILFDDSAATIYGKDQYALTEQLQAYEYKILAEETIPAGPLFSNPRATHQGILPLESYQQVASRHPDADAIISFCLLYTSDAADE